jgi:PPM family protein phosphatase
VALSLRFGAVSDIGRVRKKNDDSGYAGQFLLVVADGMGGAPAGDIASAVTIQTIKRLDASPPEDLLGALAGTILVANERLAEVIEDDPAVEGMGTTLTAALFDGQQIGVAHLGDSRGYLFRGGELLRITRDHSWVQSLIDEGRISEQEASVHSHRSLLLKVLDGRHDNEPDLSTYDIQAGDRILICSDGLSGFVSHERIEEVLASGSPQAVAAELTALALESGSTDNITVIVGDVVEGAPDPLAEPLVIGAAADRPRSPLTRLRTWSQRDEAQPFETLMADTSVDPEELRYAPRPPKRLMWLRRLALLLVAGGVIAGTLTLVYQWSQRQYFVGSDNGRVVIFQGVNAELPGIDLNHVYADQHLRLAQLPAFRRSQVVDGINADSLDKAMHIVAQLRQLSKVCAEPTSPGQVLPTPAQTPPTTPITPPATTATTPTTPPPGSSHSVAPPSDLQPATLPPCRHGRSTTGTPR